MRAPCLLAFFALLQIPALADTDVTLPERYLAPIKTTDYVEVTGTNDLGGPEDFTIHNSKAIGQFVDYLTSDRFTPAPKSLDPKFKSLSLYKVRLSNHGATVLEFEVIGDTVLNIPAEASYYMESDQYSDNLMAPLLRLR